MGLLSYLKRDDTEHDVVSKTSPTYQSYLQRPANAETGWERVRNVFQIDEFGSMSSELNSIYHAGFLGFVVGALYGGFTHSRRSYINFMETNQATAFKSHLDAKRKLQDQFTVSFAKGGFRWGWRLGLFSSSYFGIVTLVSVYRGKSSMYEYLAAGTLTGAAYKMNMGLRGMTAGGVLGGVLGGIAGAVSLLVLHISGSSMEEVRYWQYKWRIQRDEQINEALKTQTKNSENNSVLVRNHDEKTGGRITLDNLK